MALEARLARLAPALLLSPARERDQHPPPDRMPLAGPARRPAAVPLRPADGEEYGGGRPLVDRAKRLRAAPRDPRLHAERAKQHGETFGRVAIVVDDENSRRRGARALELAPRGGLPRRRRGRGEGQPHDELAAAAAAFAARLDGAAVHRREPPREREPDPQAPDLPAMLRAAREHLE